VATRTYRTILADPPWDVHQKPRSTSPETGWSRVKPAGNHYPVMPLDAIRALPARNYADDNAHLWLWVTNATIHMGRDVMEAWGFSYRSCLTWVKYGVTPGLGMYLRNQTEHLLLGIRGSAPIQFRSQATWFVAPRQEHSHKPEEQYAIVERCSPGPYLELFARRRRPGWDVWGNEVSSDVDLGHD
jgi:N6-adenosine-specific RNA methylase IME4